MSNFLNPLVLVLTCACNFLQAQVWTNLVDSVPFVNEPDFICAAIDSSSNTLYLGGSFSRINQFKTHNIIRYNGTAFDTLGSGLDDNNTGANPTVKLQMFQNKLYVFGAFSKAGSYYTKYIARWNGTSWDTVNFMPNDFVGAVDVYNNEMYVAGNFDTIGGIAANCVAKYDGVNWHSLSHPVKDNMINAIKHFNGRLYMAGQVTDLSSTANLSYWDGQQWIPWVGTSGDVNKSIFGMTVIDSMLWVYGRFNSIGGTDCKGFAAYNGKQWFGFGQGLNASNWQTVEDVVKINGEIYAVGTYDKIEGIGNSNFPIKQTTNIAKFDGEKWCLISPPFDNSVIGMIKYKGDIYAYGAFNKIGNDTIRGIGKFNGGYSGAICSPTITIKASTVGLKEVLNFGNVKIYPNPVKDRLTIQLDGFEGVNLSLDLINSMAEILKTQTYAEGQNEFDLTDLPKGIYFLRVRDSETQKVYKIIKE